MSKTLEQFDFSKEADQQELQGLGDKEKRQIIAESQTEANILHGKIELGEAKNFDEALNEFDRELMEATREKVRKEKILENFSLRNLRVLEKSADVYSAFNYHFHVSGAGDKRSGISGGMTGDAYDVVAFTHPDYEFIGAQKSFVSEAKGNLIILESPSRSSYSEMAGSLGIGKLAEIAGMDTKVIKDYYDGRLDNEEVQKLQEQTRDRLEDIPNLKDRLYQAYYEIFDNQAIAVEEIKYDESRDIRDMIADELKNGNYIVDALKKAEQEGFIKIKFIPSFYTDPQEMKSRENEINSVLDERKRNLKVYIKKQLEEELFEKIEAKKKLEEKRELISKKYGDFLEKQKPNLDSVVWERLNDVLLRFNNDKSHSRMYREYERTNGLDIKDGVGIFIVEDSSLNLEGKGGEEIDIKLVLVNDQGAKIIKEFHVRDRWDQKKDHFSKWYDEVKIVAVKDNSVSLELTRGSNIKEHGEKSDLETIDF